VTHGVEPESTITVAVPRFRIVDLLWFTLLVALLMALARFLPSQFARDGPAKAWYSGGTAIVSLVSGTLGFLSLRTGSLVRFEHWLNKRGKSWKLGVGVLVIFTWFLPSALGGFFSSPGLQQLGGFVSGSVMLGVLIAALATRNKLRIVIPTNPLDHRDEVDSNPPSA
jgi:hypothetical protein